MRLKGRHWLMLWLVLFLCVAAAVVARQTAAFAAARRLRDLRAERTTLEARRADLERRIRTARTRQVLGPRAQALGLHFPGDSEFVTFAVPASLDESVPALPASVRATTTVNAAPIPLPARSTAPAPAARGSAARAASRPARSGTTTRAAAKAPPRPATQRAAKPKPKSRSARDHSPKRGAR